MGEKGNITSGELAAAAGGTGAVIAGAGTSVTAVFEDIGSTIKDKVFDKGADAAIAGAQEKWSGRHGDEGEDPEPPTPT